MPRTANPLTAIRKIREQLDKLEAQVGAPKSRQSRVPRVGRRSSPRQLCSVCGQEGHNRRKHARKRR